MAKQFSFEIKLISVLAAVLLMVAATGLLAYKSLTGIVTDVSSAVRPDAKLSLLKQILSDLSEAESSVKSYNLTQNNDYLAPFYNSVGSVDDRMNDLQRLSKQNADQQLLADSIHGLIEKKYALLDELLALHYDEKITDELKKISAALEEEAKAPEDLAAPDEEKGSSIFRKIFGKKKTTPPAVSSPVPENQTVELRDVREEVAKVKEGQSQKMQEAREKELVLTRQGKEVMDNIRSLIALAEKNEVDHIAAKTRQAEVRANEANQLIAFFCAAIVLLLLIVSYVLISYLRKNREYSKVLTQAKTEAENLARARERFLANMSHEIRTPMNAIAGFTEQVLQSGVNREQKNQLEVVKKSADHLLKILNDILDFSKIQAGKLPIEEAGFMPREVVNDIAVLMSPQAENKSVALTCHIDSNVPEIVMGDAMRLKQVLLNLVSNAIKFTTAGEINIHVSEIRAGEDKILLILKIQDTGIGIEQGKLEHIFEEFEQANDTISQKYGGTGLGLTITKRLVELQNGTIHIDSHVGKGTRITVSIPYKVGTADDLKAPEPVIKMNGALHGKSILVADDEAYNRMLIAAMIKKWGATITESGSGEEVLNELARNHFDIVLMDIRMPGMDGIATCKKIRQMGETEKASIPVVALTAGTSDEEKERCLQAGMNDFLAKPFKEKELYQRIVSLVSLNGKEHHLPVSAKEEKNGNEGKRYSLEGVKHLALGDEKFLNELIAIFIRSTKDGFEQMKKACVRKDWNRVADYAHKIVAPCMHFEAARLVSLLKSVENNIRQKNDTLPVPSLIEQASAEAEMIIAELEK